MGAAKMPLDSSHDHSALASASLTAHLTRGAIGFGLLGAAIALSTSHGPAALLLAPPGLIALRGCPTCWLAGLVETVSAGRLQRTCTENRCALTPTSSPAAADETIRETSGTPTEDEPRRRTKSTRFRAA
jgi:hypothetical protein